jgi:hypothetical protein
MFGSEALKERATEGRRRVALTGLRDSLAITTQGYALGFPSAPFQGDLGGDCRLNWDIFYYDYGILHHPSYHTKFADNLKRELPRIPLAPPLHPGEGRGEGALSPPKSKATKSTNSKHITSEPNNQDDEEYIVRLVGQIVRVSIETVKTVNSLPPNYSSE